MAKWSKEARMRFKETLKACKTQRGFPENPPPVVNAIPVDVVEPATRPRPFMGPIHITIERPDGTFIRIEE